MYEKYYFGNNDEKHYRGFQKRLDSYTILYFFSYFINLIKISLINSDGTKESSFLYKSFSVSNNSLLITGVKFPNKISFQYLEIDLGKLKIVDFEGKNIQNAVLKINMEN